MNFAMFSSYLGNQLHDDPFEKFGLGHFDYRLPNIWRLHHHRRAIMASIVEGVYRMEKDRPNGLRASQTPMWWKSFHYDLVFQILDVNGTGTVLAAVYQCGLNHNLPGYVGAPKIVVAMRGTLLREVDMEEDIHIFFNHLPAHQSFETVLRIVRAQVDRFGPHSVCLAGHSKGAALALLVGRKLAEQGCYLEAHLFNPPHLSLPSELMQLPHAVTSTARIVHNVVANLFNHMLQDEDKRNHEKDTFLSIRSWLPHLYINSQDPVCSSYIGYFEANRHLRELKRGRFGCALSSTPHSIRADVLPSYFGRPDHLIPSAYLHINRTAPYSCSAHQLHQWLNLDLGLHSLKIIFDAA